MMSETGGLLMVFVFVILVCIACMFCYKLCTQLKWSRLLGRGNRQRIEHSSDLPVTYENKADSMADNSIDAETAAKSSNIKMSSKELGFGQSARTGSEP